MHFGYWTHIRLSVDITFAWVIHLRLGVEIRSGVGPILSLVSVVASGIGSGLVMQSGDRSAGRTGVGREERDMSVGASGIQHWYSGGLIDNRYALQSERVIFLPDHTRPSHKNWSALAIGWSAVWCECSFSRYSCKFCLFYIMMLAFQGNTGLQDWKNVNVQSCSPNTLRCVKYIIITFMSSEQFHPTIQVIWIGS